MTNAAQPTLTIGIVPRERFSVAARSLKTILEFTDLDYELVIVDNQTPPRYWSQIEQLIAGRENVRIIRTDRFLLPGPCKELIAQVCDNELTCLLENDVLVTEGWLPPMIAALQEHAADVVTPLVLEGSPHKVHADENFGDFEFKQTERGTELNIIPMARSEREMERITSVRQIEVAETHCLLFRTEALKRAEPFHEAVNTREFLDTFLALRKAGLVTVFQPASRVIFMTPPPVEPDELPFFTEKWNHETAVHSHERIREKWNLASIPSSLEFIGERWHRLSRLRWFWYTLTTRVPRRASRELRQLLPGRSRA